MTAASDREHPYGKQIAPEIYEKDFVQRNALGTVVGSNRKGLEDSIRKQTADEAAALVRERAWHLIGDVIRDDFRDHWTQSEVMYAESEALTARIVDVVTTAIEALGDSE